MEIQEPTRPNHTTLAVRLLYGALALGLLNLALRGLQVPPGTSATFQYLGVTVALVLMAGLIYLIGTGRNWARLTFAVLVLLSAGSVLASGGGSGAWYAGGSIAATLAVAQGLLYLGALVLLFLPASHRWFRSASRAGESRRTLGWLLASVAAVFVLAFVIAFAVTGKFSVFSLILAAVFGAPAADLLRRTRAA